MVFVTDRDAGPTGLVRARKLEAHYAAQLRKIARHVGEMVNAWAGSEPDPLKVPFLRAQLAKYAEVIRPWAQATAGRLIAEIAIKERRGWAAHAREMSRSLRDEILNAPTGQVTRQALHGQVSLITSLPTEAAERVHKLTLQGMVSGTRSDTIAREIMRTGEVTASRANTIARTEVGRTATELTKARAQFVGSTGYAWMTAGDSDVRPSHARMAGKFVEWDSPPTLDGMTGHAGCLPNCRCIPRVILPEWK